VLVSTISTHHIAAGDAEAGGERGGHADAPPPRLPPRVPPLPAHHRGAVAVDRRGALDEAERRQRRVVRRAPHRAGLHVEHLPFGLPLPSREAGE
ncbi:Os03g0133850, partial [Oryza sativa Japonica Group]